MRKLLLILVALCGACSKGAQADLPSIGEARTLGAEWALINEQAAERKLTANYVATMRSSIRQQLQTTAKSLTQANSPYGAEIQALLQQPDDAPPQQLRGHVTRLKQIEDSLKSA